MSVAMLDQVTEQFLQAFRHDAYVLQQAGLHLFFYFTLIQLTVTALWQAISGQSLAELLSKILKQAMIFGILFACIHHAGRWIPHIINGFVELGQQTGVNAIEPAGVLDQGFAIAGAILRAFGGWGLLGHPFVAFVGAAVCISVIIIYGLIAAELVLVIVKSYFLVSLSSLFFALGATDVSRPMLINSLKTVIGIGLQLMTLYCLIGVGQMLGDHWATMTAVAAKEHQLMPMFAILAAVIVYFMIIKNIPTFVAGLAGVGGFRNYGDAAVASAISAGTSGAGQLAHFSHVGGKGIQGAGQFAHGLNTAISVAQAAHAKGLTGGSHFKAASHAVKAATSATSSAVKDVVMRQNPDLTFGQKMNKHMSNTIGKKGASNGKK